MVVRRGLDVPGLRTGGGLGRVLPDGPAYLGKHQTAVGKLFTGDIGAVVKLQYTQTNDTLCEKGKHYLVDPKIAVDKDPTAGAKND